MFGKAPDDSFPTIFDLSFDSDDSSPSSRYVGSRSTPLSSSPLTNVFNNAKYGVTAIPVASTNGDEHDLVVGKRWKHTGLFSTSNNDDLEKAFANLITGPKVSPSSTYQDPFSSSLFPFKTNGSSVEAIQTPSEARSHLFEVNNNVNSCRKNLALSFGDSTFSTPQSAIATPGNTSRSSCSSPMTPGCSAGLPAPSKINTSRYKTELCRPFQENGTCKYAEKCQFAHGLAELRSITRHPKYKTDLCRTYHSIGFCPYGPRCHFIHSLDEAVTNNTTTNSKSSDVNAAITALKQLPMFSSPDRGPLSSTSKQGFGPSGSVPRPFGITRFASSDSSGFSSANSLSPSLLNDLDEITQPRLPVFSRLSD